MVKNPPCNAGESGSIPGWGTKIPHAEGQLSQTATTMEAAHHNSESVCHNERSHTTQRDPSVATET